MMKAHTRPQPAGAPAFGSARPAGRSPPEPTRRSADQIGLPAGRTLRRRALLALAALALTTGACITDFGALEEQPAIKVAANHPPYVSSIDDIIPANTSCLKMTRDSTGCEQPLRVLSVFDGDAGDELKARWFIDFNRTLRGNDNEMAYEGRLMSAGATDAAQRVGPSYKFRADQVSPGVHVVTVVVSDGFAEAPRLEIREGKASWSASWCIDTTAAGDCVGTQP